MISFFYLFCLFQLVGAFVPFQWDSTQTKNWTLDWTAYNSENLNMISKDGGVLFRDGFNYLEWKTPIYGENATVNMVAHMTFSWNTTSSAKFFLLLDKKCVFYFQTSYMNSLEGKQHIMINWSPLYLENIDWSFVAILPEHSSFQMSEWKLYLFS